MAAFALVVLTLATGVPVERRLAAQGAVDATVLDLAFVDERRLAVLTEGWLALLRIEGPRLTRVARLALPGEPVVARAASGLLRLVPGEESCWVVSNRRSGATLFTWSGDRLAAVGGAEAIPPTALPASAGPAGARFEAGTNRLALRAGAVLRLTASGLAVAGDGSLLVGGEPDPGGRRVGDAIADLGDGYVVASAAAPPGAADELRVFGIADPAAPPLASWPVSGRIRALAAWTHGPDRLVAVAVDDGVGAGLAVYRLTSATP